MNVNALKPVSLNLPAHIADLIEETRNHLPGQWEDLVASAAEQVIDSKSFESCRREFDGLFVDSQWTFDGPADRAAFVAPLMAALRTAHERHHAGASEATAGRLESVAVL